MNKYIKPEMDIFEMEANEYMAQASQIAASINSLEDGDEFEMN